LVWNKTFGGLQAVQDLDLTLNEGEILGLIGPNGAGKSTVFNLINGVFRPDAGRVLLEGKEITGSRHIESPAMALHVPTRSFSRCSGCQCLTIARSALVSAARISRFTGRAKLHARSPKASAGAIALTRWLVR
jgi:ABC-type branched-subunit amino acid transport system ATPase component